MSDNTALESAFIEKQGLGQWAQLRQALKAERTDWGRQEHLPLKKNITLQNEFEFLSLESLVLSTQQYGIARDLTG